MTRRILLAGCLSACCSCFIASVAQVSNVPARDTRTITGLLTTPSQDGSRIDRQSTISVGQFAVPEKARSQLYKAWNAVNKNKLDDATHYVEKALSFCPHFAEALTLRAILETQDANSIGQAQADAEKAIEYDPNYGGAYIVLGTIYSFYHQYNDAIRTLDRGIALLPNISVGYFEMGIALVGKGDFAGGLRQAQKASSLDTAYPYLHLLKAYAYEGLKDQAASNAELEVFRRLQAQKFSLANKQKATGVAQAQIAGTRPAR